MPATQEDARLLLQVYDLRREAALRRARDFIGRQLKFKDFKDYNRRYKETSQASRHVGMVLGYWDMVCTLVAKGLLNDELFQLTNFEHVSTWFKLKPLVEGWRELYHYPGYCANLEAAAMAHPGAVWFQQPPQAAPKAPSRSKR